VLSDEQFIDQLRAELHAGLEVLEPSQELLAAVEELTPTDGPLPDRSRVRPAGRDQRRWRGRVRGLGAAVPVLAAVIVVVVVGAVALSWLRPQHSSMPAGPGIAAKTGQIAFVGGTKMEFASPDGAGLRDVGAVPDQCRGTVLLDGQAACFAWSPDGKQFAYLAGGFNEFTLYLVDADGRHPRRLTACGDCQGVSWSPDGSQIAVGRYVAGQWNVWVVNAKTGAMRRITDCQLPSATCGAARILFQLQWSPDGRKIFFIRTGDNVGAASSLGTVRPDGSVQTELQIPELGTAHSGTAHWSPDGRELAVNAANGVYIVDAAGAVRELTKLPDPQGVAWSPDGRKVAVANARGIYTVDADGKDLTRLAASRGTPPASGVFAPAWSPNGKELAYAGWPGPAGVEGIWTIHTDGSDRRLIYKKTIPPLHGAILATVPIWSPDGSQLAFSSNDGTYVVNSDGAHLHRIGQGDFGAFAWQPIPSTR
jgi:Tol biopolymer transport system component